MELSVQLHFIAGHIYNAEVSGTLLAEKPLAVRTLSRLLFVSFEVTPRKGVYT